MDHFYHPKGEKQEAFALRLIKPAVIKPDFSLTFDTSAQCKVKYTKTYDPQKAT